MGIISRPNSRLAILNVGIETYPSDLRQMVMQVLFAARLVLMRKWKSNLAPKAGEEVNLISETYYLEQIMAYKHG